METLYNLLGISFKASTEEIKAAYRTLAKRYHPDQNPDKEHAAEKFRQIKDAYDILINPLKRTEYDRTVLAKLIKQRQASRSFNQKGSQENVKERRWRTRSGQSNSDSKRKDSQTDPNSRASGPDRPTSEESTHPSEGTDQRSFTDDSSSSSKDSSFSHSSTIPPEEKSNRYSDQVRDEFFTKASAFKKKQTQNTTKKPDHDDLGDRLVRTVRMSDLLKSGVFAQFSHWLYRFGTKLGIFHKPDRYETIELSTKEAIEGTTRTIKVKWPMLCQTCRDNKKTFPCPPCHGTGRSDDQQCPACQGAATTSICPDCAGTGYNRLVKEIILHICGPLPPVSFLRLLGQGVFSRKTASDTYVMIKVRQHPLYRLERNGIYFTLPISFFSAVLGGKVEIPFFSKRFSLSIAPGTQSGQRIKMNLQDLYAAGFAVSPIPIIITIRVEVPGKLSDEQKNILKNLQALSSVDSMPLVKKFYEQASIQ